tara:strand:+ start:4615 stop:4788 length:174 start_codon:yes stop_codon:yes gene_type:complete
MSTELPDTGKCFEGLLPPVVAVFTLADYVGAGVLEKARISLLLSSLTGYRCACPGES